MAASSLIAFAVAGFLASLREPNVVWTFAAAAGIRAAVGIEVLRRLLERTTRTAESAGMPGTGGAGRSSVPVAPSPSACSWSGASAGT